MEVDKRSRWVLLIGTAVLVGVMGTAAVIVRVEAIMNLIIKVAVFVPLWGFIYHQRHQ